MKTLWSKADRSTGTSIEALLWVSFCFSALLHVLFVIGILLAQSILLVESFVTARAHIYGQDLNICQKSSIWPHNIHFEIVKRCGPPGIVSMKIYWMKKKVAHADVNLRDVS